MNRAELIESWKDTATVLGLGLFSPGRENAGRAGSLVLFNPGRPAHAAIFIGH